MHLCLLNLYRHITQILFRKQQKHEIEMPKYFKTLFGPSYVGKKTVVKQEEMFSVRFTNILK